MEEQRYPVSQADFETIRERGFVYVDKTGYIHRLVSDGVFYFLGRPRRFGKSLLISTIKAYFEGKRNLFKGLAIDRLQPGEWKVRPVLRLDLSADIYNERDSLVNALSSILSRWEKECGIRELKPTLPKRFEDVILAMEESHGSKVVILIDEYDSPLSAAIDKPELFEHYRDQLHGFYSVLKAMEPHIQFCMLTGVTKFGKVSVFSGLNNLNDITLDNRYAGICGITEAELHGCFDPGIARLAEEEDWSIPETYDMLRHSYDGYHFSRKMLDIYNPYSVLNALDRSEIKSYWNSSGIPTLLTKMLRDTDYRLEGLDGSQVSEETLDNLSVYQKNPVSLFFQTGYLTIKAYDRDLKMYTLGYPNREVERGILSNILGLYMPEGEDANTTARKLRECLRKGDPERFVAELKAYLSGIPSKLRAKAGKYENYYHTVFYCILSLIGLDIDVEYNTSEGFIDAVVKTRDYIYVIELKLNGTAEDAMRQIEEKHYASPFATDVRRLYRLGIGFSKATGTVDSSLVE